MDLLAYALLFIALYFEVFLLISFLQRGSAKKHLVQSDSLPSVAVVVPCYNEEKSIVPTIESLLALRYPKEKIQIIVVDDGSTDKTLEAARRFEARGVRVLSQENGGKYTAMNLALQEADAELIASLDADSTVDPDALVRIIPAFSQKSVAAVTAGIHIKKPVNFLQRMQYVEYRISLFNRLVLALLGSLFTTPGPFSVFRTAVLQEIGGWRHGHSTEDMEIALRLQERGYAIANAPRAVVYTAVPETIRALFRQRIRWTYGWVRNSIDFRRMFGNSAYGNLGMIVLPFALVSIAISIYFFLAIVWNITTFLLQMFVQVELSGVFPAPSFELFYVNTSALLLLTVISLTLMAILIWMGSRIAGRSMPASTPLYFLFYSFLAPLWLSIALTRAIFKTGVRW